MLEAEKQLRKKWRNWQYKNTSLLVLSLVLFFYFIESPFVQYFLTKIGSLGYLGALISGIMFVSAFTIAPASAIIFDLVNNSLNPLYIAIIAGFGGALGDYLLLRYLKDNVFKEIAPLFQINKKSLAYRLFASPYFTWIIPILGAAVLALPIPVPDEVGISLMGVSKIKTWQFIALTFGLNIIAILIVINLALKV